jgi:hypothetical protein
MRVLTALFMILLALPATAQEADPPLPRVRPDASNTEPAIPLPRTRPAESAAPASAPGPAGEIYGPPKPEDHATKPAEPAEPRIYQTACPAVLLGRIEATSMPPIAEGQCVAQSPLALTGVLANGRMVPVAGGVTTDCGVASALPAWLESVDSYLMSRENTRIAELVVGTSYICRNVNNAEGGNLSFHAFADALDVVGFRLEDGRFVTVEEGWADALSPEGRLLRFAHDSACGHFTTVLGPEANALHEDHFHLDLGCHGKTCTARLCE